MLVNLVFDYYTDVINVPDEIGTQIKKYQKKCDKWLYNKDNNHQYWKKMNMVKSSVLEFVVMLLYIG